MTTTACPYAAALDRSCPALHRGGSCTRPGEVARDVRRVLARTAEHHGLDEDAIAVDIGPGSTDGSLRVVLRSDHLTPRLGHELAVRSLPGLCAGARRATTTSVCVRPLARSG